MFTVTAQAYLYDGNHLSKLVVEYQKPSREDSTTDHSDAWAYRAYVIGVNDAVGHHGIWCAPRKLHEQKVASIVAIYMAKNPSQSSNPGSNIVIAAMKEAFPFGN
jgi:hypothetical protein